MDVLDARTAFLDWCSVINSVVYSIAFATLTLAGGFGMRVSARIFKLPDDSMRLMSVEHLAHYKPGVTLFAIVPWLVLSIMGRSA